jgi:hypothetical protein
MNVPADDENDELYMRGHAHGMAARRAYAAKPEWVKDEAWHPAWRADIGELVKNALDTGDKGLIYFVSGPLHLTRQEFKDHYEAPLSKAVAAGGAFVVGDARGADTMAMQFLIERTNRVTIFHMLEEPRNFAEGATRVGGFQTDEARDAAMTRASHVDIAWVRPGRGRCGTAQNLIRRAQLQSRGEL